ncbi:Flagellar motor rotation protein MotB [Salipiger mucosus DSM 16094]|uniref:Flagellar motor rotation protein MotB n=2 Tax=Salipiger mucosus TaxID=263378 RepID=S9Q9J0_9RHOB|nr:Flagellar motor rotation protein MotB [Salipiger mucosus DSM 16094]
MMAFFLLMWLVNTTEQEDRNRISEYFNPYQDEDASQAVEVDTGIISIADGGKAGGEDITAREDEENQDPPVDVPEDDDSFAHWDMVELTREEYDDLLARAEQSQEAENVTEQGTAVDADSDFRALADQLEILKNNAPIFREYAEQIIVDEVTEGLRIQFVDQEQYSMFPQGSTDLTPEAVSMIDLFGDVVKNIPNRIAITGHTDSTRFGGNDYGNWELSADRANAARRALIEAGLEPDQIESVEGKAATDLLLPDRPDDARNRRITFIVTR